MAVIDGKIVTKINLSLTSWNLLSILTHCNLEEYKQTQH